MTAGSGAAGLHDVYRLGDGAFVAETGSFGMGGLFGGQLAALGLTAGMHTVPPDWVPQSLHAYFLSPGTEGEPVRLHVEVLRDGRRSGHRRITVMQHGKHVADVTAVFGQADDSPARTRALPPVSGPSAIPAGKSIFHRRWRYHDLDIRTPPEADPYHPLWVRSANPGGEGSGGLGAGWATAAFVSDLGLVLTAPDPDERRTVRAVTSEHTVWFHQRPDFDDWHLLDVHREVRTGGRAVVTARLVAADGSPVASAAQGVILRTAPVG